jgi:hypothetical protein
MDHSVLCGDFHHHRVLWGTILEVAPVVLQDIGSQFWMKDELFG